MSTTAACYWSL